MIWLIPVLLICLFLLFRFVSPYELPIEGGTGTGITGTEIGTGKTGVTERTEGFLAPLLVSPECKKGYQDFVKFNTDFFTRWRDAMITTYQLEQPALTGASAKEPTDTELNATITKLTTSLGKPLPLLPSSALPPTIDTLDDIERGRLLDKVPSSAQPYMDALEWMNQKFIQAEKDLNKALQGGGIPSLEGFLDGTCAEIATCFKENPDLIRQLGLAQQEEAGQRLERIQRELIGRFEQFQQPRLRTAFELNERLSKNAKETQRKAQSGDWIKDVRIGAKDGPRPVVPPGGDALEELRTSDPEKYREYQTSQSSLFSVKQLMEQINRNLR
jgi:hypothetical protein